MNTEPMNTEPQQRNDPGESKDRCAPNRVGYRPLFANAVDPPADGTTTHVHASVPTTEKAADTPISELSEPQCEPASPRPRAEGSGKAVPLITRPSPSPPPRSEP